MARDIPAWETRILAASFAVGVVATLLFLVAYSSEYWVYVILARPQERSEANRGEFLKVGHYHGLWRICRQEYWHHNKTASNDTYYHLYCRRMYFAVPDYVKPEAIPLEWKMLHFRRSTVVMGSIALVLAIVAHGFAWYSLGQLRYVYKRLSGCLELITAACTWVTLEVFRQSIKFEKQNMQDHVPQFSKVDHGWSFNLVWISLILYIFPGVTLLVCSRKRKGRKARSMKEARENEPVNLGRF